MKSVAFSCKETEALVRSTAFECATEMLPSSSTVPPPALTSSIDCKRVDNLMNRVSQSDSDDSKAQESGEHQSDKAKAGVRPSKRMEGEV
jgi:hypothetical protein